MAGEGGSLKGQPSGGRVRDLIVVAWDQLELWQALKKEFGDRGEVEVLLERRSFFPHRR